MTVPFLLIADLLAKLPSEPATPQIKSESASELYKADDVAINGATNQISRRDISPPEVSSFLPGSTDSWSNHWLLNDSQPELPPLARMEKYLPLPPPPSTQTVPSQPQTHLRYSSFTMSYVPTTRPMPVSGPQLYHQRLAALKTGQIYTRLSGESFWSFWANATEQPTYEQWKNLLANEARAIAFGQGSNRLSVLLGDSITLWFPHEQLSRNRLWLNQGISGDTTTGILNRLSALLPTRPDTIYLMAGINDLRRGETDATILGNFRQIMRRLRQQHPDAQVVVQSILPTQLIEISNARIRHLNRRIEAIAQEEGAQYLDVYSQFIDAQGNFRPELTTDGLHLNAQGYQVWRSQLRDAEASIALYHRP
jgi:lysophospholipase L1-like esterase